MSLIDLSAVFSTPKEIFLPDLLKPFMIPHTTPKETANFPDVEIKKNVQNSLNYLNITKETPQTY